MAKRHKKNDKPVKTTKYGKDKKSSRYIDVDDDDEEDSIHENPGSTMAPTQGDVPPGRPSSNNEGPIHIPIPIVPIMPQLINYPHPPSRPPSRPPSHPPSRPPSRAPSVMPQITSPLVRACSTGPPEHQGWTQASGNIAMNNNAARTWNAQSGAQAWPQQMGGGGYRMRSQPPSRAASVEPSGLLGNALTRLVDSSQLAQLVNYAVQAHFNDLLSADTSLNTTNVPNNLSAPTRSVEGDADFVNGEPHTAGGLSPIFEENDLWGNQPPVHQ